MKRTYNAPTTKELCMCTASLLATSVTTRLRGEAATGPARVRKEATTGTAHVNTVNWDDWNEGN